jgi:hypothetical protein
MSLPERRMRMLKEFALYKGEECLGIGTVKELAKELNVLEKTVRFYKTPSYLNRLAKSKTPDNMRILVDLEDEKYAE